MKSKGEKERYTYLNAEFQRIARRDIRKSSSVINAKKYRKTMEWDRLEISSRKSEIPREHFMQRWAQQNRKGMDLTEAEDIKKRWQEYTEELYKKDLHDSDNHDGVITHLEPDILECEVKWALGSIIMNKASGGGGIPAELFQILKDDALKCCTHYAIKFGKLSNGHRH